MGRKSRKWKRPGRYRGGYVVVNRLDLAQRDYMSPGRLVAWAEWVPNRADTRERRSERG